LGLLINVAFSHLLVIDFPEIEDIFDIPEKKLEKVL